MAHKKGTYNDMYRSEGKYKGGKMKGSKMKPPDLDYMKKEMRMSSTGGYGGNPPKGEPNHNPEPKGKRYPSSKGSDIAKYSKMGY